MIKLILIVITTVIFSGSASYAQADKNGGSLYSIFGIGDLNYSSSSRTESMGILGLALTGNYTNTVNPASWTGIQYTRFSTRFNFERITSTNDVDEANRVYASFEGFNLSIPLNKGNGWIVDLGINRFSNVNYDTKLSSSSLGENFTQYYSGNGGLSRMSAGLSYIIFRDFSIGAQFNYAFGNIAKKLTIDFTNPLLFDTKNTVDNSVYGFYLNTGLIFRGFGKLFRSPKLETLSLGAFFSTPFKLNSNLSGTFARSTSTDSVSLSEGTMNIPWSVGGGLAYEFPTGLVVATDLLFQKWDDYEFYGRHPEGIKNSLRVGAGLEYTPSSRIEDIFILRISYRLGSSFTSDYIEVNSESVNSFSFNAGLSLPIAQLNNLDLLFSYIIRGNTSKGLVRDDIIRIGAAVNIGDLWFIKRPEDY